MESRIFAALFVLMLVFLILGIWGLLGFMLTVKLMFTCFISLIISATVLTVF